MWQNFMGGCSSLFQPSMAMGNIISMETLSLGGCQPRLKKNSLTYEVEAIPDRASNWYFKRSVKIASIVMGTIFFSNIISTRLLPKAEE